MALSKDTNSLMGNMWANPKQEGGLISKAAIQAQGNNAQRRAIDERDEFEKRMHQLQEIWGRDMIEGDNAIPQYAPNPAPDDIMELMHKRIDAVFDTMLPSYQEIQRLRYMIFSGAFDAVQVGELKEVIAGKELHAKRQAIRATLVSLVFDEGKGLDQTAVQVVEQSQDRYSRYKAMEQEIIKKHFMTKEEEQRLKWEAVQKKLVEQQMMINDYRNKLLNKTQGE